ncbi:MAG: inositol monophosphatase [Dysgonamonadaceae bacterium]|jgi:myo-inositol-1(or 4)-monophosphatase|nr:inositol monophosphatase [Dysgonamonadaceae bacterium]
MENSIEFIAKDVCRLAVSVGAYLREEQQKLKKSAIEMKGARNYVTYVDKEAEKRLVEQLKEILPDAGFLTEEATVEYVRREYTWMIDPLDGTTNYVHGDTPFSVSIALMKNDEIVLGVVYDPVADELFSAVGGDARLNGEAIRVSDKEALKNGYIGFGIPYSLSAEGETVLRNAIALFRECSFRMKGSSALEICYVACGRFDAYFHSGLSPWDVAAGSFILKRAGGKATDFSGGDNYLFGKEIVASNGKIHDDILSKIIGK